MRLAELLLVISVFVINFFCSVKKERAPVKFVSSFLIGQRPMIKTEIAQRFESGAR
jgi:hypothetical protein